MDEQRQWENKLPEKNPRSPFPTSFFNNYFIWVILLVLSLNYITYFNHSESELTYSQFLQQLQKDNIQRAIISASKISGELKTPLIIANTTTPVPSTSPKVHPFTTNRVEDPQLVVKLREKNVEFSAEVENPFMSSLLSWILPLVFFFVLWSIILKRMGGGPQGGILGLTKSRAKIYMQKEIHTTFADVAGVDEAKEELMEVVNFLQSPQKFSRLGGRVPKGVLLVGPPGTGKTLLAKAVAGEAKVPFFSINGPEFVEMFVGLGAARVRDLFKEARKNAPCIIFIDEVDALGKSRSLGPMGQGPSDEKEQTLNQLLAEMDGFDATAGIITLAATNRPEILDPALLRAGRFDRQVMVGNPDQAGRTQILQVHAKKIVLSPEAHLEKIAALTPGFSGADLANLVNEAALAATRRGADDVTEQDFTMAIERIIAGLEQKKKVMNAEEKKRIAFHEMGHATVALGLKSQDKVHKVSIIPRGMGALGYTLQRPTEDRYLVERDDLMVKMAILMGGRVSEKIFLQSISTGASDDLTKASEIARAMVTQFAMSEHLGPVTYERRNYQFLSGPENSIRAPYSEKTAQLIDGEINNLLQEAYQLAHNTLLAHAEVVQAGAQKLLQTETLDEEQLLAIWEKNRGDSTSS